jgi:1-deoxy-D-xylulose-5-phosphate reductoisomerase
MEAARVGGELPAVLSAANEVAVAAFLEGRLNFGGIPRVIGEVMNTWVSHGGKPDLHWVLDADARARRLADALLPESTHPRSALS